MSHHHDILGQQESVFQELEGQIVTLKGFYDEDSITGEVLQASYDHLLLRVVGGKFSGAKINVDLHVLLDAKPKVRSIIAPTQTIELYDSEDRPEEFAIFSAETEVKKQVIQFIKYFEQGRIKLEEVQQEIGKMNLSIEMLRIIRTVNHVVVGLLISQRQDAQ